MTNRYFYDSATGSWGAADDLEIIELDDSFTDADEIEEELEKAAPTGAGHSLKHILELIAVSRCALADLEGIMPEHEPSGDRKHPGWRTIEELKQVLGRL